MLTINYNGKTYIPKLSYIDLLDSKAFENCIKQGYLEEVKENKEHPMIKCVRADLLREELEKLQKQSECYEKICTQEVMLIHTGEVVAYRNAIALLTSLEQPKEEPQPQEDIELLPEFKYDDITDEAQFKESNDVIAMAWTVDRMGERLELLTNAVNQLIKANKK